MAGEADDASDRLQVAADPATRDVPSKPYVAGVTLDQIDEMVLLLESLAAHGDVVTAADHAEFAPATLSLIGYSICRELRELRDIVGTIHHDQPQEEPSMPRSGVREEQATYLALLPGRSAGSTSTLVQEHPTYQ